MGAGLVAAGAVAAGAVAAGVPSAPVAWAALRYASTKLRTSDALSPPTMVTALAWYQAYATVESFLAITTFSVWIVSSVTVAPDPALAAVIETPVYDLTVFKLHFGKLTLKAYTKGEHVLRFEAITHNTGELRTGRVLDRFCDIVTPLAGMLDRFLTVCDSVHASFADDHTPGQLPQPARLGATRLGGIDINRPRARAALSAALSLASRPAGFTAADFTAKIQVITGDTGYTARQAAYDMRKLRAKHLINRQGCSRRYQTPPDAVRTIAGILLLRDQVLIPCLAAIRDPALAPPPASPSPADQHYAALRTQMRALLHNCGLAAA